MLDHGECHHKTNLSETASETSTKTLLNEKITH